MRQICLQIKMLKSIVVAHEEVVTKPNENVTTKSKNMKPQIIVLTKSSKKKKPKIKQT